MMGVIHKYSVKITLHKKNKAQKKALKTLCQFQAFLWAFRWIKPLGRSDRQIGNVKSTSESINFGYVTLCELT